MMAARCGRPMICCNLVRRRMLEAAEPRQALDGLLFAHEVGLTDIVSLARWF